MRQEPLIAPRPRPRAATPLLSLIIPVFNECEAIGPFLARTRAALEGHRFELLFVDDGSRDATRERLIEAAREDARVRVISLSRNFGKEAALTAGLDHAEGEVVVPIDVDLQDPPELIPRFLSKWRDGFDVVYGVRCDRAADSPAKRATAGGFYRLFNRLSPISIPEHVGDFRLLDRRVVEVLRALPERNRFMKGLFAWVGFSAAGVPYERTARVAGRSKWDYWRLWNFALDGIAGFSTVPLRVWSYIGAATALAAFVYALFIVVHVAMTGIDVPGYASLMTVVLLFSGIQLLSLGVLGEYLGRLFTEAKGRPIYVVDTVYGRSGEPQQRTGTAG